MMTFDPAVKEVMTWRRSRFFRSEYELQVKQQLVAFFRRTGFFNWQAEIYEGEERNVPVLEYRRSGVFHQKVSVKPLDYRFSQVSKPIPVSLRGELWLELDNGRTYHFRPTNFWQTRWALTDEREQECLTFQRSSWGFGGKITINNAELSQDELLFLIYTTWCIVIMKMEDQAAAS